LPLAGQTTSQILASYPSLASEAIRAALAYASELARERFVATQVEFLIPSVSLAQIDAREAN
jgi:hypothetical protein